MGYLNAQYGTGSEKGLTYTETQGASFLFAPPGSQPVQSGTALVSGIGQKFDSALFSPGGYFGGARKRPGYGGAGSKYLSTYGFKETQLNTRAIDRYQNLYGRKDAYVQEALATTGILDQARAENALGQQRAEGAIYAAGNAQQRALAEAEGYIDQQAAYGYQQAADLESRILGETRSNLSGSGLWNSSMQGQAATFALERGMRARLAVNSQASGLYQRIALGKGAAAADTYTRLAGFYESARQTNERSLIYEFDWRAGRGAAPKLQNQGQSSGAAWAGAAATVLAAIAVAW